MIDQVIVLIIIASLTDVQGQWHGGRSSDEKGREQGHGLLCDTVNGNKSESLNDCPTFGNGNAFNASDDRSKKNNSALDNGEVGRRGEFIPLMIPMSTFICIVVTFVGLYIYLYMQEKRSEFEKERAATGSTDSYGPDEFEDFGEWRHSEREYTKLTEWNAAREDAEGEGESRRTVTFAKYPKFQMSSFSLEASTRGESRSTGISFFGRPKVGPFT